jgi:hypothetical protein
MPFAELVFAVYLGGAHTQAAPLLVDQPTLETSLTFADVSYRGNSFTPPLYYGYRLSLFPQARSQFGIEGEFIHLKAYARTDHLTQTRGKLRKEPVNQPMRMSNIVQQFSISHGLNLVLVNVVARRTIDAGGGNAPRVQLLGRAGAGPTLLHPESTVEGVFHEGYQRGSFALQTAVGLELRMTRQLAVLAEYKFTRTAERVTVDHGTARGTFATHHGVVGIAWHSR